MSYNIMHIRVFYDVLDYNFLDGIEHFIVQLMHRSYKILILLK